MKFLKNAAVKNSHLNLAICFYYNNDFYIIFIINVFALSILTFVEYAKTKKPDKLPGF